MKRMTKKRYFKELSDERYSVDDWLHTRDMSLIKTIIEFGPCGSDLYYTGEIIDRLAAYENTGLEPEEIETMAAKKRLNDKHDIASDKRINIEEIIESAMVYNASVTITESDGCRMITVYPPDKDE